MQGHLLTQGELKHLPDDTKVHVVYTHPDPTANTHDGIAYVKQLTDGTGCYLNIGGPDSTFSLTYEYEGKDTDLCDNCGDDGDAMAVCSYQKPEKKNRPRIIQKRHWRQLNPRDQVIAILSSVEGLLSNASDGIYGKLPELMEAKLKTAIEHLTEAQSIVPALPTGAWTGRKR